MKKATNKIGERFINKPTLGSCEFVIVKYNNSKDLWVQFQDKYGAIVHTGYSNCQKGSVKNPYHPSVFGVGMIGLMSDGSKPILDKVDNKDRREYILWHSMLRRCYSDYYHSNFSTYLDAEVCERWLIYTQFLEDLPLIEGYDYWINHPNEHVSLDKDIKGNGSKLYCLENCKFISNADNVAERNKRCSSKKVYAINIKTGERTRDFNSMTEASKEIGINKTSISRSIKGKQKTCGGYKWFKVES